MDPHSVTASLDIALNNPLSQSDEVGHMTCGFDLMTIHLDHMTLM